MNLSMKQKQTQREQPCSCQGREGSLELVVANYYT